MKQNSRFADRLNSIVALIAMGCALVFSARGTASAASTVQLTAPANGATVSGTISLSCTVPSNVAWINIDVDYGFYATGSYYETTYSTNWNSASVANGSHTIQCNGYASNGSLLGNPVANIRKQWIIHTSFYSCANSHAGRISSRAEWMQYYPGYEYASRCGLFPIIILSRPEQSTRSGQLWS
jgi:hypothetical protein